MPSSGWHPLPSTWPGPADLLSCPSSPPGSEAVPALARSSLLPRLSVQGEEDRETDDHSPGLTDSDSSHRAPKLTSQRLPPVLGT